MVDHLNIPGIKWASAPGVKRLNDYVDYSAFGDGICRIVLVGEKAPEEVDPRRVIPIVEPLDTPEECEPETPEVITYTGPGGQVVFVDGRCVHEEFTAGGWHPIGFCDWLGHGGDCDWYIQRMVQPAHWRGEK